MGYTWFSYNDPKTLSITKEGKNNGTTASSLFFWLTLYCFVTLLTLLRYKCRQQYSVIVNIISEIMENNYYPHNNEGPTSFTVDRAVNTV